MALTASSPSPVSGAPSSPAPSGFPSPAKGRVTPGVFLPLYLRCPRCGEPVNPSLRPGRGKPFRVKRQCSTLYGCQRRFILMGRVYFTHSTHRSVEVRWVECDYGHEVTQDAWVSAPCVYSQSDYGIDNLHDDRPCPECVAGKESAHA